MQTNLYPCVAVLAFRPTARLAAACVLLAGLACLLAAGPASAQAPPVGQAYTDNLRGFSICPPAGADIRTEAHEADLVTFNVRDGESKNIRLWMKISKAVERRENTDPLESYAKKLVAQLRTDQNFQVDVEKSRIIGAAGKKAIDLQGPAGTTSQVFCRQVWVQIEPETFLVVSTYGPLDRPNEVMAVSQASLNTLTLFDPKAAMEKRKKDLEGGQKMLEEILAQPQKVRSAVVPIEYWLAILKEGDMIGFAHYRETLQPQGKIEGVQVECEIVVATPEEGKNLSKQKMWASLDASQENWEKCTAMIDPKSGATAQMEYGLKQNEVLLVQTQVVGQGLKKHQYRPPLQVYVPQAFAAILPRLVTQASGTCSFATFDSGSGNVDMRTLSYVGTKTVTIGGRPFEATVLTDQMAVDAPLSTVYLNSAGIPLKIESRAGTGLQQTTRESVLAKFGKEYEQARGLNAK